MATAPERPASASAAVRARLGHPVNFRAFVFEHLLELHAGMNRDF
jgi:hypothetical protein